MASRCPCRARGRRSRTERKMQQAYKRVGTGLAVAMILVLSALWGCGNGDSSSSGQSNSGGGNNTGGNSSGGSASNPLVGPPGISAGGATISSATRMAAIQGSEAKLNALQTLDVPTRNAQMVAYLKSQSAFEAAGTTPDGSIWARFTDGRYYVINDTLEPAQPPSKAALAKSGLFNRLSSRSVASSVSRAASGRAAGPAMPKALQARLLNTLDAALAPPTDALNQMLTKRGYQVLVQDATVDNLKHISGDGVFHISTHGGTAVARDKSNYWSVWTSTPVSETNDTVYKADLDSGRLVYFSAANGYYANLFKKYQSHYAITGSFLSYYHWSFANNCVAFLNFCWSNEGGFAQAVVDSGAGIAAGWSNAAAPEKAWKAARFFFDRLLGTNMESPETGNQ